MPKYAIITGASKGIGEAAARLFLEKDWKVINISRKSCPIDGVINLSIDLSKNNWHDQYHKLILSHIPKSSIICLVHNAAQFHKDSMSDIHADQLRDIMETNVIAPVILNQLLLPKMTAGSSIIYIGSTLSEKAVRNTASYTISKHASVGMMRSTCQDLADTHIHTGCICPGFTDTEMLREHVHHDKSIIESLKQRVGANRLINPKEIADTIYFMANHPVLNGSVIHANLGQIEQ